MLSPAAQHRAKVEAEQHRSQLAPASAAQPAEMPVDDAVGEAYRMLKIRLNDDVRRLKTMRSRDRANTFKAEILSHYWGYCSAVISRQKGTSNGIVTHVCIWCFDIGEYGKGLLLADYALSSYWVKPCGYRHTLTPEGFNRNLAEVLAEIMGDNVLKSSEPYQHVGQLETLLELTCSHDMNDHISAKLHRAYALAVSSTDPAKAIQHYTESLRLRPLSNIRKTIARLEKRIQEQNHD